MKIALKVSVLPALLLLTIVVFAQNENNNASSRPKELQGQKVEVMSSGSDTITAPKPESAAGTESFSQLTLFLFGSGVGLLIALLAWSDQIRGIDKDIRELEQRFVGDTGIEKQDYLRIVKPETPDDRGRALTQVVNAGKIRTKDIAVVLTILTKWHKQWSRIEGLSALKYRSAIALTLVLFLGGVASLFTTPAQRVQILSIDCSVEMLLLVLPAMLIGLLLIIIIWIAERENGLRSLLKSISEMV